MRISRRGWSALLALLAVGDIAAAHQPGGRLFEWPFARRECCPSVIMPGGATVVPGSPTASTDPGAPQQADAATDDLAIDSLSNAHRGSIAGNVSASGVGVTAAAAAGQTVFINNPLILPGLLTASQAEAIRPSDRIFFSYSRYDEFQVIRSLTFNPLTTQRQAGFDLNRYDFGVEKTFLDGRASLFARVPILDAVNNTSTQSIESFGDISLGMKFILWDNPDDGHLLSAGLTVSLPTGRDAVFPTQVNVTFNPVNNFILTQTPTATTNIDPTYIQPWIGGQIGCHRLFVQNYFGVIIPTDDTVATFINDSLTVGYALYEGEPCSLLSSITPTVSVQALLPTNHRGSAATPFGFSDQFFLNAGAHFGIGERALLSTSIVTPLSGPRPLDVGFTIGFNFFF